MTYSPTTYTGDGIETDFTFSWPFLDEDHVKVYVAGALQSSPMNYSIVGLGTISFGVAPNDGDNILIKRETPVTPLVVWSAGSTLIPDNLNKVVTQAFYIAEENTALVSDALGLGNDGHWDGETRRLRHIAAPVDAGDAVNKNWAENSVTSQIANAISAADTATTQATLATTQANLATTRANEAQASADAAALSAEAAAAASTHMSWTWDFDTNTGAANPGLNQIRFNNASLMSATEWYINETAKEGAVADVMATWDDSSSAVKATVTIRSTTNINDWFVFHITAAATDNGAWRTFTIQPVAFNGTLSNGEEVRVMVVLAGDAGTGAVNSWKGRTGSVVPATGDYNTAQLTNDTVHAGGSVKAVLDGMTLKTTPSFSGDATFANAGASTVDVSITSSQLLTRATVQWSNAINTYRAGIATKGLTNEWSLVANPAGVNVTAISVDDTGKVGIGRDDPQADLHVAATAVVGSNSGTDPNFYLWNSGSSCRLDFRQGPTATGRIQVNLAGSTFFDCPGAIIWRYGVAGTEMMRLQTSGRLGIGTASPGRKLHVEDPAANQVGIRVTNSVNTAGVDLTAEADGSALLNNLQNTAFTLSTNNSTRIIMKAVGGVELKGPVTVDGAPISGSWEFVAELTPSGASSIDVTGLDLTTYHYMFGVDLTFTNQTTINCYGSVDNGVSWRSAAGDYRWRLPPWTGWTDAAVWEMGLTGAAATEKGVAGTLQFASTANKTSVHGHLNFEDGYVNYRQLQAKYVFDAIRIIPAAGTVTGTLRVYRLQK